MCLSGDDEMLICLHMRSRGLHPGVLFDAQGGFEDQGDATTGVAKFVRAVFCVTNRAAARSESSSSRPLDPQMTYLFYALKGAPHLPR